MGRIRLPLVLAALLVSIVAPPVGAVRPDEVTGGATDVYIVLMAEAPVLAYEGGVQGIPATQPKNGQKVTRNSPHVGRYAAYLNDRHAQVLAETGIPADARFYDYTFSLNGFAATLTPAQASKIAGRADVLHVERDVLQTVQTDNSPEFLGLTDASGGLWEDAGLSGEDVIIGVIDTGIWPEHPSFSDQADLADRPGNSGKRTSVYDAPPVGWAGTCQAGELWSADDCNNKLIGARYFLSGFGKHGISPQGDYKSARDHDGHGTHTASTAGGNAGVSAEIFDVPFGTVSGIAPRARIAAYKALWNDEGGFTTDLAAAIDAAVADGVDVINYSIGSSSPSYTAADDIAFLFAARAGVHVATSAGNDGPGASTIGSPSADPWVTTVGASTQDRTFQATATFGNGSSVTGASVTEASPAGAGLVDSEDVALAGADAEEAELCFPGTLDPAKVTGKVALCLRGVNARVDKSLAVQQAGGVGMILYNPDDAQALVTDNHWVPSVHVNYTSGLAVKAYIDAAGSAATATISASAKATAAGSVMADFSSRGPNGAADDIIKPDVTAPGVNILAGNTPTPFAGRPGQLFQSISGTSMSSPHVAGLFALMKEEHPTWSPGAFKSSLMTTARQDVVKEDGTTPADPFDFGSGHVVPNSAINPGLVYDTQYRDYLGFLCGNSTIVAPATCSSATLAPYPRDASDLNIASIAVGELVGNQTVKRTVTNVSGAAATWTATASVPGFDVVVPAPFATAAADNPSTANVREDQASFQLSFTRTTAALDTWAFGELVITSGAYVVRSPIALRPAVMDAPNTIEETTTTDSGSLEWQAKVGYNGTLSASGYGLVADAVTSNLEVNQDPDQDPETDTLTSGVYVAEFKLEGAQYFAGGTRNATTEAGSDLDVFLLRELEDGIAGFTFDDLVAFSAGGDSEEIVELVHPADGTYKLLIHGWGTPDGASTFSLHAWVVDDDTPDDAAFSAQVETGDPYPVTSGQTVTVTATYAGVTAVGTQYRGLVDYSDGTNVIGSTVVQLDR